MPAPKPLPKLAWEPTFKLTWFETRVVRRGGRSGSCWKGTARGSDEPFLPVVIWHRHYCYIFAKSKYFPVAGSSYALDGSWFSCLAVHAQPLTYFFIYSNLPLEEKWRQVKYAAVLQLRRVLTRLEFQTGSPAVRSSEGLLPLRTDVICLAAMTKK